MNQISTTIATSRKFIVGRREAMLGPGHCLRSQAIAASQARCSTIHDAAFFLSSSSVTNPRTDRKRSVRGADLDPVIFQTIGDGRLFGHNPSTRLPAGLCALVPRLTITIVWAFLMVPPQSPASLWPASR